VFTFFPKRLKEPCPKFCFSIREDEMGTSKGKKTRRVREYNREEFRSRKSEMR